MNGTVALAEVDTNRRWQFWIDRGGTFTDVIARRSDGVVVVRKLLSENPQHYLDAGLHAIRDVLKLAANAPVPGHAIEIVRMGTTVATNALLERKGSRTALAVTRGFADSLRIGDQHRPKLFVQRIQLPSMLYDTVMEVDERIDAHGNVEREPDLAAAETQMHALLRQGITSCAIVLMHGYRYRQHEESLADLACRLGFTYVSVSHRVSPLMKFVTRGGTTVVDAYLTPILRQYIQQVARQLPEVPLQFMQSSGGLTDAQAFNGKDAILSGPAGGVIGAVRASRLAGFHKVISFDMGGTSTDVAHYAGEYERAFDTEVAGVRMSAPIMQIHTVAAGGGSICRFDGVRLRVGPESAGANPGPAAYRRGGPITITDCNVLLGRIQADFFPAAFGEHCDLALDTAAVAAQFSVLVASMEQATRRAHSPEVVAAGCIRIAVESMANAIKKVSIQRGYDVREYVLTCFGGAAGQHACLVADALGMSTVFIHPLAGVLSAYGIGLADVIVIRQQAVERLLEEIALQELVEPFAQLEKSGREQLRSQGITDERVSVHPRIFLKYAGTDSTLQLRFEAAETPQRSMATLVQEFETRYRSRFGFLMPGRRLLIDSIAVEATGHSEHGDEVTPAIHSRGDTLKPLIHRPAYFEQRWRETPFFDRATLLPGDHIEGPAVICEANTTTVLEPGWRAEVSALGQLILRRSVPVARTHAVGTRCDPILLEVFNNLFMSIAEQMGVTLASTATSVNIKERLDFSCALFDAAGLLIANAPHMPVHLGSMGESVQEILRRRGSSMRTGDLYMLNAPYSGGTHLPDITVVMPVFLQGHSGLPQFFVAARGHHADIGGITPGSMPANSVHIEEEGVLLDNVQIVANGVFLEEETRMLLTAGRYPVRNVEQNLADLRAQIAACQNGAAELAARVEEFGLDVVQAYMGHVQDNAEEAVRCAIGKLRDGEFAYPMDNGATVRVAIRIDAEERAATIDFSGTSAQQANNYNAPASITRAAVLYVFRTLVDDEIPLNAGCFRPLRLVIPQGSILSPTWPAAVVAGNVETSQVVTDCLYGALGVLAGSQGTMNNFTFGDDEHQYYETISGGSGAGPDFDGADAVQTHMTNSRLTDPEVLEWRFPVRLESFRIRRGSGGTGFHRGGDGVERRIRFMKPMTAVLLANNRVGAPFGVAGGGKGAPGRNWIERVDGRIEEFGATHVAQMGAGDVFTIQTPGGGGFGPARS